MITGEGGMTFALGPVQVRGAISIPMSIVHIVHVHGPCVPCACLAVPLRGESSGPRVHHGQIAQAPRTCRWERKATSDVFRPYWRATDCMWGFSDANGTQKATQTPLPDIFPLSF